MTNVVFRGPLFIVGMPRSGTKLLRDILNEHPEVGIPKVESHFIPFMIKKFGTKPDFECEAVFDSMYAEFEKTAFFWSMQRRGLVLRKAELRSLTTDYTWPSLLETIFRFYMPRDKAIWGDKTPGYLQHVALLKGLYPNARFLHIIRDPRDYCVSVSKAWSKNIFRAAHIWQKSVDDTRTMASDYGADYMEVRYEALLDSPEVTLTGVCEFLDLDFDSAMLSLSQSPEEIGEAKGATEIVSTNKNKFAQHLPVSTIRRIEEIVFEPAVDLGYQPKYAEKQIPVKKLWMQFYKLCDGLASLMFHIRKKGLRKGIPYFFSLHKRSSWR